MVLNEVSESEYTRETVKISVVFSAEEQKAVDEIVTRCAQSEDHTFRFSLPFDGKETVKNSRTGKNEKRGIPTMFHSVHANGKPSHRFRSGTLEKEIIRRTGIVPEIKTYRREKDMLVSVTIPTKME